METTRQRFAQNALIQNVNPFRDIHVMAKEYMKLKIALNIQFGFDVDEKDGYHRHSRQSETVGSLEDEMLVQSVILTNLIQLFYKLTLIPNETFYHRMHS